MRILMLSALEVWALVGQGGAPSLYKTLTGYAQRGHQIDFVTSGVGANHHHGAPVQEPPHIFGVRFHRFQLPTISESRFRLPGIATKADQKLRFATLFPMLAAKRARYLMEEVPYDLVYGYEVHGVLAARMLQKDHALPTVARFQGTVMHPYLDKPLSLARKYEEVLALRTRADLYVMTDDGTKGEEVLHRLNPHARDKTCFWRNGLDLENVRPPTAEEAASARTDLGLAPDDFVLVTSSRLARWKRIDRAIDALALLRQRGVRARLLVVGDGEERENLERQAAELGVLGYMTFVGAVQQAEVQRYLWAADVSLSVNELSNVGNPLLEAMLSGRCILTLDEGDTRTLIRHDETGVLLATSETSVIAGALMELAKDPERRQGLAHGALELAQREFWSWSQRLDAEVDAVEALLKARAPVTADA